MYMKIRNLTDEEYNIISSCITNIIEEDKNSSEAIYANSYQVDDTSHIDIQFIKNDIYYISEKIVNCEIKDIIIRKIDIPSIIFTHSLEYYRKNCHPMNLLNSEIIKDTDKNKYKELAEQAGGFGFGAYNNNISFNPPITLKRKK